MFSLIKRRICKKIAKAITRLKEMIISSYYFAVAYLSTSMFYLPFGLMFLTLIVIMAMLICSAINYLDNNIVVF